MANQWQICSNDNLPDPERLLYVKADPFPESKTPAVLIDTAWGTKEFILYGAIHVEVGMVRAWKYAPGHEKELFK